MAHEKDQQTLNDIFNGKTMGNVTVESPELRVFLDDELYCNLPRSNQLFRANAGWVVDVETQQWIRKYRHAHWFCPVLAQHGFSCV